MRAKHQRRREQQLQRGVKPPPRRPPKTPQENPGAEESSSLENMVDTASNDSFPCSDPPGYYSSHC